MPNVVSELCSDVFKFQVLVTMQPSYTATIPVDIWVIHLRDASRNICISIPIIIIIIVTAFVH